LNESRNKKKKYTKWSEKEQKKSKGTVNSVGGRGTLKKRCNDGRERNHLG